MAKTPAYVQYAESFNRKLRILSRDLNKRYPNDPTVYRAHQRTMTVIVANPLFVIDQVGPYLLRYRDQIYAPFTPETEAFFLQNDFDTELKEGVKAEKVELAAYIIPKAKECAATLGPKEKEEYRALVAELLDDYLEYLDTAPRGQ